MPIPADNDLVMVEGWHALLSMQERGRVTARRLAYEMIRRPIRRAAPTDREEKADG